MGVPNDVPCKICGGDAPLAWVVDFAKSCEEAKGVLLPLTGFPVYFRRCEGCGFAFTTDFDEWEPPQFCQEIYNEGYRAIDPDYAEVRPRLNAEMVQANFGGRGLSLLDYGAGNRAMTQRLTSFSAVADFDPLVQEIAKLPDRRFDLVTSFEAMEHTPRPRDAAEEMAACLEPHGLVLFSTLTFPGAIPHHDRTFGASWWYCAPRNGHVSLYTREALRLLWGRVGLKCGHFNDGTHWASRQPEAWELEAPG